MAAGAAAWGGHPSGTGSGVADVGDGGDDAGDSGDSRVRALQREVAGVTAVMAQNVQRVLARGENLEQLHGRSQELEASSEQFRTTSQKVARRFWWRNVKLLVVLGLVGAIILVIIILLATGVIPT